MWSRRGPSRAPDKPIFRIALAFERPPNRPPLVLVPPDAGGDAIAKNADGWWEVGRAMLAENDI